MLLANAPHFDIFTLIFTCLGGGVHRGESKCWFIIMFICP